MVGVLLVTAPLSAGEECYPRPGNRLFYDLADFFPAEVEARLEGLLRHYYADSHFQVVVIVTDTLCGTDIAMYANEVGQRWGVGVRGRDDGAVVVMLPKRPGRRGQIFIAPGRGIQDRLPDAIVKRIIEEAMIPRFRAGDYVGGLEAGLHAMARAVGGQPPFPSDPNERRAAFGFLLILGVILGIAGFRTAAAWGAARQRPEDADPTHARHSAMGVLLFTAFYAVAAIVFVGILYTAVYLLLYGLAFRWGYHLGGRNPERYLSRQTEGGGGSQSSAPWIIGGGGWSSGGGFGGGVSFGGGSFNGGGAGGSW